MSDQEIAAIGRRVANTAARAGYERSEQEKQDFKLALTELCAAVKAEAQNEHTASQN